MASNATSVGTDQEVMPCVLPDVPDAWLALLRAHAMATRELSAQLVRDHGLTINDYEALVHLANAPSGQLKRVELSERLLLTPSGVTRMLNGLEDAGLVCKGTSPSDARVTYAVLTDTGREKLTASGTAHMAAVRAVFERYLDESELDTLAQLLTRLHGGGDDHAPCNDVSQPA